MADDLVISVQPLDGQWVELGSDVSAGIRPQAIRFAKAIKQGGATTCTFELPRSADVSWPDIRRYTPVHISIGAMPVWSGRVIRHATAGPRVSGVECEGWWQHLSDDVYDKAFVVTDLTRFKPMGQDANVIITEFNQAHQAQVDDRAALIPIAKGTTFRSNKGNGVYLDAGPNNAFKSIALDFRIIETIGGGVTIYVLGSNEPMNIFSGTGNAGAENVYSTAALAGNTLTPVNATFTNPHRYVSVYYVWSGADATAGGDYSIRIERVAAATAAAFLSGGTSVLKASTIIKDVLTTACPKISADQSLIQTTTFTIPAYDSGGYQSPETIVRAVDVYHGWRMRLTNEPTPRFEYAPQPTTASWAVSSADSNWDNPAADDGAEIFNRVLCEYEDATGVAAFASAVATGTEIDRRNFRRTMILPMRLRTTAAAAQQVATAQLATRQRPPLKGTLSVQGRIRQHPNGASFPVAIVNPGDMIMLEDLVNPETGAKGRLATIAACDYDDDTSTLKIELDSDRDYIDNLVARLGS